MSSGVPMVMRNQFEIRGARSGAPARLFLSVSVKFTAALFVGGSKQEIGAAVQHGKAPRFQLLLCPAPRLHDSGAGLVEVVRIFQRGLARLQGQPVDVVGVEAELDPVEVGDELRIAHSETQPRTGQLTGLREGLDHQQIFVSLMSGTQLSPPKST